MTYPPNPDPSQSSGSPYTGGSPYTQPGPGGSPYPGAQPPNPYASQQQNPYAAQQPNPYGAAPFGAAVPPSDNIAWAIAAIFLCWPFAIPAFIASGKVADLWRQGDFVGANKASADAKKWGSLGVWIGLGIAVFSCCLAVALPLLFGVGLLGAVGSATGAD